jgi:hypothetical protein
MALAIFIRTPLDRNLAIKCNFGSLTNKRTIMAGYSGTPLPQKLGIKPHEHVVLINAPKNYVALLGEIPKGTVFSGRMKIGARFAHLFSTKRSELQKKLVALRKQLAEDGTLWVSWPKKSAGVPTDITEDVIRAIALPLGFVDIKVCAVDETWSGLKLMVRRANRRSEK